MPPAAGARLLLPRRNWLSVAGVVLELRRIKTEKYGTPHLEIIRFVPFSMSPLLIGWLARAGQSPASQPPTPPIKSSIAVLSPRLFFKKSPSTRTRTSKGFVIATTRVAARGLSSNSVV